MALATLSIDLVAQLAQLQQGMDKAGRLAEKAAGQIEAKFKGLSRVAGTVGVSLAGALSVAGLSAFFRTTVEGIDKLNDLADATGSSVEKLSALEDAARRTGTGVDVVGDALIKLNKTIADAKPGSDQEAALRGIGLSAAELKKLDPADALLKTAQALAGFADDGNKARLTQELFGKSLKDVAPLLKDLVEKGQLNATVTKEQAEEAEKFRRQTFELEKNLTDLSRTITSAVVPAMNAMFDRIKKEGFFSLFKESDAQKQIEQANNLANSIKVVGDALQRADALSKRADLPGSARSSWAERAKALRTQLEGLQRQALTVTDAMKGATVGGVSPRDLLRGMEAGSATRPSAPDTRGGPVKKPPGADEFGPFAIDIPPALRAAMKAIDDADETKLRALRVELAELVRLSSAGFEVPDSSITKVVDQIIELDPAFKAAAKSREEFTKAMDAGRAVFDATRTPAEVLAAEIDRLNKLLQAGAIDWDTYARATFDAQDAFDKKLKPALEEVSEFAKEASRNIQDALGDSILQTMEGNAKSIGDIWKTMLKRMVAEAAAANLAELLLGKGYGSKTGNLGGLLGAAAGFFTGGGGGTATGGAAAGSGGGGFAPAGGASKPTADGMSKGGGAAMIVNVQGDVGPKALRAMRTVAAESQAKQQRRMAMGSA